MLYIEPSHFGIIDDRHCNQVQVCCFVKGGHDKSVKGCNFLDSRNGSRVQVCDFLKGVAGKRRLFYSFLLHYNGS